MREALEKGTATIGVKLAGSAIEGGVSGTVGGSVDAVTNEDTWRGGVSQGLTGVLNSAIAAGGQGAAMSAGMTGAQAGGARLLGGPKPHGQGEGGQTSAGTPDPHATADPATAAKPGAPIQPGQFFDAHPLVGMARGGDDLALRGVLADLGQWEVAISHLTNGTGKAAGMTEPARKELIAALVGHRRKLLTTLDADFGARPVKGASTEAGSDVDLNVMGETAGQKLLDARRFLDQNFPGWQKTYRMALLIDASRVGTVNEHLAALPPAMRAQIEARITRTGELYALARRIRSASPEERGPLLERISGDDKARVEQLVAMDDGARRAAHDLALREGDAATQRLRGETDPAEKARLAAEVTERQMLANMLNDDAYITPGGVGQFAAGRPVKSAAERYQAAVDQIDMIGHQVHESQGVLKAMRKYEIFKYMQRFCDLAEGSGLATGADAARLVFFRNWAEYIYRVEREATGSATTTAGPRNLASSADKAGVRLTDPGNPRPGVSDKFLLDNYRDFQAFADRMSGRLRQAGMGEGAPAVGGTAPGGDPAPLITMPKLTADDQAALAAPDAANAPGVTGVTGAAGAVAGGVTPLIGKVNEPIGRPVANENAARVLVTRLTAGDATALTEIGVTLPPNYDPRGREWGIGRTKEGNIVIIEGMVGGVKWDAFAAAGGTPISHSHPMLPGREMAKPGRTMAELLPGTGRGDADAIHVLPSVEDFMFCGEHKLQMHEVLTPYANIGGGKIGNPAPGLPLISFRIVGIERVGDFNSLPVYRALLAVADSAGGTFDVQPVWVVGSTAINEISTSPPAGMVSIAKTGATGTGGASGAGQGSSDDQKK
ncbi:MAG TPA: hypothetical protein VMP03_12560 [Methylomirabilota bacterium]|nr:hypothetical protein [Methylomirabilota bacterium]